VNEIITRAVARPTACDIQACKTSDLHDECYRLSSQPLPLVQCICTPWTPTT
jgi:hypothetical protein